MNTTLLVIGSIQLLLAGVVGARSARFAEEARAAGRPGRLHDMARRRSTWIALAVVVGLAGALNVLSA